MLVDCLGRHPDLYGYPRETKIIPALIADQDRYGDLRKDENFLALWRHVCRNLNYRHPIPVPDNWSEFPRDLSTVIDAAFRYFALREGKSRWCEKTPQHLQHLQAISELFPGARFIHIIRDGRDCAASLERRFKRLPEHSIFRWKNAVRDGRRQGAKLGERYMEVRYEEVTADPEPRMKEISEFIGLNFHEDVLLSRHPQTSHSGSLKEVKGGLVPNSGKWRRCFAPARLAKLEKIAGRCLAELGYPTDHASSDVDPSSVTLTYWRWRDYIREFVRLLTMDLSRQRKIRWAHNLRRITSALKQSRINRY